MKKCIVCEEEMTLNECHEYFFWCCSKICSTYQIMKDGSLRSYYITNSKKFKNETFSYFNPYIFKISFDDEENKYSLEKCLMYPDKDNTYEFIEIKNYKYDTLYNFMIDYLQNYLLFK